MFSRYMCLYKALLLNDWSTLIITICCLIHSVCNKPLRMTRCCSNESMLIIVSIALVNTRDFSHCAAWELLPSFEKIDYFPGEGIFLNGVCKFLINDLCVGVVTCSISSCPLFLNALPFDGATKRAHNYFNHIFKVFIFEWLNRKFTLWIV